MNKVIFEQISHLKRQILPNERVILFGSQVRGDARPDSDWDLLILLDNGKEKRTIEDCENYAYPFDELGWEYGVAINALVYTTRQWERGSIFPFYRNVMREGIEIK